MSDTTLLITIIVAVIASILIYKWLKPYILKYDTTLFLTGGLGSGKTLTAVKTAIVLIRKNRVRVNIINTWRKTINPVKQFLNTKLHRNYKINALLERPYLYSNFPINYKTHFWTSKANREWSKQITLDHILLFERINLKSVVILDELPQWLSQYEWILPVVQNNFTEFVTFFRHYVQGYLITTCQSTSEIVAPLRRKSNQATWCFNFKKHLLGLFYTMECCDIMLNDDVSTTTTSQISDNTRKLYGLFPPKNTYSSTYASERYKNLPKKADAKQKEYKHIKTNEILRLKNWASPCDDTTTKEQREKQRLHALERKINHD